AVPTIDFAKVSKASLSSLWFEQMRTLGFNYEQGYVLPYFRRGELAGRRVVICASEPFLPVDGLRDYYGLDMTIGFGRSRRIKASVATVSVKASTHDEAIEMMVNVRWLIAYILNGDDSAVTKSTRTRPYCITLNNSH